MPTAAKLVSAVLFLLVGYAAARLVEIQAAAGAFIPYIQPAQVFGFFPEIVGAIGVLSGWFVIGPRVGRGMNAAFGYGVRTSATIVFYALLLFSVYEGVVRALRMIFHGPFDTIQAMVGEFVGYAHVLLSPAVLGVLILGGGVAGMLAEAAGRRWR